MLEKRCKEESQDMTEIEKLTQRWTEIKRNTETRRQTQRKQAPRFEILTMELKKSPVAHVQRKKMVSV